jgi:hypothetical protein
VCKRSLYKLIVYMGLAYSGSLGLYIAVSPVAQHGTAGGGHYTTVHAMRAVLVSPLIRDAVPPGSILHTSTAATSALDQQHAKPRARDGCMRCGCACRPYLEDVDRV